VDYATIAYNASSGSRHWQKRFNGLGNYVDVPLALAVSPDGSRVLVTGFSSRSPADTDYTTIAYAAWSKGRQRQCGRVASSGDLMSSSDRSPILDPTPELDEE
jgi:hypothetical protein